MSKHFGAILLCCMILLVMATGCTARNDGMRTNQYNARQYDGYNTRQYDGYNARPYDGYNARPYDGYNARPYDGYGDNVNRTNVNSYQARSNNNQDHTGGTNTTTAFNKQASEKIHKEISKVKGVKKSTVVVHNRDAIVGIEAKAGVDAAKLAKSVKKKVEKAEPGYTVHVTTDKNLHTRIQNFHQQMVPLDGHPIRNFAEDVGILIQDIGRAVTAPFR